jgi:hypothetical protein
MNALDHALFINDLKVMIYSAEKDVITLGSLVLVVMVDIFYYTLMRKTL